MDHCPTCRAPVIATSDGLLLDARPHPLGINRPDGTRLTEADIRGQKPGQPAGHRTHRCPQPRQEELFGGDAA